MVDYDTFIEALSQGKLWDLYEQNRLLETSGDRRLSDFGRPGPQYYASNTGGGNRGIVLDPNKQNEVFGPPPSQEQQNQQLEKFHQNTPGSQWKIEDTGDIDPAFIDAFKRYFTG